MSDKPDQHLIDECDYRVQQYMAELEAQLAELRDAMKRVRAFAMHPLDKAILTIADKALLPEEVK